MITNTANLLHRTVRYLEAPGLPGEELLRGTRTLILIHGFPLSADMWLPQMARVPQGWRFVAPDIRGFRGAGPSYQDAFLDGATMDDYAQDVLDLMDHIDAERAAICGLSMGGYVAMALAAKAPKRVSHLILADTRMTPDSDEARAGRDKMRAAVEAEGPSAAANAMMLNLLGATSKREQPDLEDALRRLIEANRIEAIVGALGALKSRPDRSASLATFQGPTLVICGEEDALTKPVESEAMAAIIPNAQLVLIPKAGHMSNLEQPAAFNEALAAFLGVKAR